MKRIPLTRGLFALVDSNLFKKLNKYKWHAIHNKYTDAFYACRKSPRSEGHKSILMHRLILGLTDRKLQGDHKNHDTLDNRRENLRVATASQNGQNRRGAQSNSVTGIRGVFPYTKTNKFQAIIVLRGKRSYLGLFDTVAEAATAYEEANRRLYGEFGYKKQLCKH